MAAAGAPADVIAATLAVEDAKDDDLLEIWEENWETVMCFLSLSTQWRREIPAMAGTMIWHGLDYPAVESTIRLMGYWQKRTEIFEGLQIMEQAALKLLNKPSK